MCEVSVLTSVYNCEKYVAETIDSIVNQSFEDWEYIIIDDNSKDNSAAIIEEYQKRDKRIKFYRNDNNYGQVNNLNKALELANGEYIAHLDHDDICRYDRLQKQVDYMKAHPDILLVGSRVNILKNGKKFSDKYITKAFTGQETKLLAGFQNIMGHSTFFWRKNELKKRSIKYKNYKYAEDYALVCDVLKNGAVNVMHDVLVDYRVFPEQTTAILSDQLRKDELNEIRCNYLSSFCRKDANVLETIFSERKWDEDSLKELEGAFEDFAVFCGLSDDKKTLKKNLFVGEVYLCMMHLLPYNMTTLRAYLNSSLKKKGWMFTKQGLSLVIHCLKERGIYD